MKLITFLVDGRGRLGVLHSDGALDLAAAHALLRGNPPGCLRDMQAFIDGGEPARELADELLRASPTEALIGRDRIRLRAPLPVPVQVRDFMCFEQHVVQAFRAAAEMRAQASGKPIRGFEVPRVWYERPVYYKANRFAVSGPEDTVSWPPYSRRMDYELELAAVIGKKGRDIAASDAGDYIFGYTIFNDFSARDTQAAEMAARLGPAKGKDFDGANAFGPCIVTADELNDVYALEMLARVNGQEWSRGNSRDMYWRFEDLIAYVSQSETIYPGEIFGSGTVGSGCGLEHKRFLHDGDLVELEIQGIGILRNTVVAAPPAERAPVLS